MNQLLISNEADDPAGWIDLNDNPMIVSHVGFPGDQAYEASSLREYVKAGRDGSAFRGGHGGIESSVVDSTPGMAVGYARAGELFGNAPATFAGQTVLPTDFIVRTTRAGDINLDRKVDFDDLVILAQNYGQSGRSYAQGNVNLSQDGVVDFDDLVTLAQNYGTSVAPTASPLTTPLNVPAGGGASSLLDLASPTSKSRPKAVRAKIG